jgi:hypothetical protein
MLSAKASPERSASTRAHLARLVSRVPPVRARSRRISPRAAPRPGRMPSSLTWAGSLNNLSLRLADLGRREESLAAIEEAAPVRRELAERRPGAHQRELNQSLQVLAWLTAPEEEP